MSTVVVNTLRRVVCFREHRPPLQVFEPPLRATLHRVLAGSFQARALGDVLASALGHLATKSDLETEITKVSARIEALDAKVDAFGTQIRFVFAALAVLLALDLIDTVPRLSS